MRYLNSFSYFAFSVMTSLMICSPGRPAAVTFFT